MPSNFERCWLEVRCKITGSAIIQIGLGYWKEAISEYAGYNVNSIEAGVSDWYYKVMNGLFWTMQNLESRNFYII